jgi:hypothetical protein
MMFVVRRLVLLISFALYAAAMSVSALAADVVYPTGSRVGLVPPPGVTVSRSFAGFEDRNNNVAIIVGVLPPAAFTEIEKSTSAEALQKQGVTLVSREDLQTSLGKATLVIGSQQANGMSLHKWILAAPAREFVALVTVQVPDAAKAAYPDAAIRAALQTLTVREIVPAEEHLSLLPFKMSELAGFKVGGVVAGRAIMLTDGTPNAPLSNVDTHMIVAVAPGGPPQTAERDKFGRDVFSTVPNLKEVRITTSESLRIGGQWAHQIIARAKDAGTGSDVTVVQWIRFGGGGYLHLIGISLTEAWTQAYPRFRQVRDGVAVR